MPKLKAKNLYWTRLLVKFLDVTAGIATIAVVKNSLLVVSKSSKRKMLRTQRQ
jgi:hypothetical protein